MCRILLREKLRKEQKVCVQWFVGFYASLTTIEHKVCPINEMYQAHCIYPMIMV